MRTEPPNQQIVQDWGPHNSTYNWDGPTFFFQSVKSKSRSFRCMAETLKLKNSSWEPKGTPTMPPPQEINRNKAVLRNY